MLTFFWEHYLFPKVRNVDITALLTIANALLDLQIPSSTGTKVLVAISLYQCFKMNFLSPLDKESLREKVDFPFLCVDAE